MSYTVLEGGPGSSPFYIISLQQEWLLTASMLNPQTQDILICCPGCQDLPLFGFLSAKKECSTYSKHLKKETLREKWSPIVRLFKNKLYVANLVATVTSVFIASGFGTFAPKFFQVFLKTNPV